MKQSKYVYYSVELDELFALDEPKKTNVVYRLIVDGEVILQHIIYLGEL